MKSHANRLSNELASQFSDEINSLKRSLAHLRSEIGQSLGNLLSASKSTAESARASAGDTLSGAKDHLEHLQERGAEAFGDVGKTIEEHPVFIALVAFAVGFVVAKIMDRHH